MNCYYLSEKEYNQVYDLVKQSETKIIRYQGLIIQLQEWLDENPENDEEALICTYEKDVLSHNYEWYFIPNPADYR